MDESIQKRGPRIAETGSTRPDVRGAFRFGVRSVGIPIQEGRQSTPRKTLQKGMNSWLSDAHFYMAKSVRLKMKSARMVSHVYSCVTDGALNWPWTNEAIDKFKHFSR